MPSKRKAPEAAGSASVSASDKAQKRLLGEQRRLEALAAKRAQHKQRNKATLSRRISVAAVPPPAGSRTRLVFDSSSDEDDGGGDSIHAGEDKDAAGSKDTRTSAAGAASQTVAAKVRKNWMGSDSDSDSDSGDSSDDDDDESDGSSSASASAGNTQGKRLKGLLGSDSSDSDSQSEASGSASDDDEDESQLARRFRLRPEFEGVAGKRLLDLQRRVADPRFEFDSRFADSLEDGSGVGSGTGDDAADATSEAGSNRSDKVGEDVIAENTHSLALLGSLFTGVVNPAAPVNPNESEEAAVQDAKHLFGKMIKQARFDPTALTSKSSVSGKKHKQSIAADPADAAQNSAESTSLTGTENSDPGSRRKKTAPSSLGSSSTAALAVVTAEEDESLQRGEFKVKSGWSQLFNRKDTSTASSTNSGRVVEVTTEELERGGKSTTEEHREAYVQANKQDPIMFSFGFDVDGDSGAANSLGDDHGDTGTGQSAIVAAFDGEGGTQDATVAAAEAAAAGKYGKKYRDILDYGYVTRLRLCWKVVASGAE